jgi:DNA-binding XRE family transcriptional regulator
VPYWDPVTRRPTSPFAHGRSEVWDLPGMEVAIERARRKLALQLRALRAQQNWTQEELAERAGLHPQQVIRLENARANPSLPTLVALGLALKVCIRPTERVLCVSAWSA